ncbi:type I restriction endonuclease [Lactiplantibacillus pentosus]|uniref:restriction endonuclease subunit S n=1 Tax=Lactiplantibacillus pentosus TaxID=1589 RepID=UPI000D021032|nr:restriction endonuclease subunit S [Lactiplantibacillus pentosus]PRO86784.1 type I restriction endonuclease [Lactiplantibacillus pentosus]
MKNENLVPKVRFKGFSDPWEQRKLSEIGKIQGGGTPDSGKPEYWNGTINWFTPTEVSNNGFLENSIRKITNLGLKKSSATLLPPKTVLITSRAGVGNMGILKYPASTNQGFQSFIPDSNTDEYFIYSMQPFISRIANRWASGSTFTEISGKQMAKIEIGIPDTSEQKKISGLMKIIDNLIAANEDELEQLKTLKKLLMQKIFSQEWRFKGFTDPWEQRKLGEFLTESRIRGTDGLDANKLTVKLWGKGVVEKNSAMRGSVQTKYYVRRSGQFIYGKLDFLHAAFGIIPNYLDCWESTLDSPSFDISDEINSIFLLDYVLRKSFYLKQGEIANGSRKAKRIHVDTFLNMPIVVPYLKEQDRIGSILTASTNLIAANEDKLQQLKELKKYLMQNMFV